MSNLPMTVMNGHPEVLAGIAQGMQGTATRLRVQSRMLAMLRHGATWQSPAGAAFGARLQVMPTTLDQAVHRYAAAARAVRDLAGAMGKYQPVVTKAIADWREAERQIQALASRVNELVDQGADPGSTMIVRLEQMQTELVGKQNNLVKVHDEAWRQFRAVDARCAAALDAAARDCVSDSRPYRAVSGAKEVAGGVEEMAGGFSVVQPELAPVASAAGAVARASELAMLVFYGEGSWKDLGVNVALTGVAKTGGVLVKGGLAGSRRAGSTIIGTPGMTTGERVKEGIRLQAYQERNAIRGSVGLPAKPAPPATTRHPEVVSTTNAGAGPRQSQAEQVLTDATGVDTQRLRQVREDWLLASAGGPAAQRMYVSGEALKEVATRGQDAYATNQAEQQEIRAGQERAAITRDERRQHPTPTRGPTIGP